MFSMMQYFQWRLQALNLSAEQYILVTMGSYCHISMLRSRLCSLMALSKSPYKSSSRVLKLFPIRRVVCFEIFTHFVASMIVIPASKLPVICNFTDSSEWYSETVTNRSLHTKIKHCITQIPFRYSLCAKPLTHRRIWLFETFWSLLIG